MDIDINNTIGTSPQNTRYKGCGMCMGIKIKDYSRLEEYAAKSNSLSYQAMVQSAFRDSAAENATRQFNAKNQIQVEEFFAQLGSQVEAANANRVASMRQFNVSESNAMLQFNKQIQDSREKFNASAKFAIDQSNVTWRREVNTANTAVQNETNPG